MTESMGKEIEVAILFADVVGSTKLYELLGDLRARDMVGICIDVMRAATDQNHGTVIKTMGDEVMATFPTADDALERGRADAEADRRCTPSSKSTNRRSPSASAAISDRWCWRTATSSARRCTPRTA